MACSTSPMTNDVSVANDSIGDLPRSAARAALMRSSFSSSSRLSWRSCVTRACSLSISPRSAPSRQHDSTTPAISERRDESRDYVGTSRIDTVRLDVPSGSAWLPLGPAPRRHRAGVMRELRAVPAALPDVPGDGGGRAVTARPDRCDAVGAMARMRRSTTAFVQVHGDVRAVPGMRAGVPERRSVRPADRGHQGHPRLGAKGHDPTAAAGAEGARPSSSVARRVDAARRRAASAAGTPAARAATGCRCGAGRAEESTDGGPCGCSPGA